MQVLATLQTKLACGALVVVILNVCISVAIITVASTAKSCDEEEEEESPNTELHGKRAIAWSTFKDKSLLREVINEHPWMVAFLILPENLFIGSATIISRYWAITTASCTKRAAKYPLTQKALSGGSSSWDADGFIHFVQQIIANEKFNPTTLDHNVALVQVSRPFNGPKEVPLAVAGKQFQLVEGTRVQIIGWTFINENKLESVSKYLSSTNVTLMPTNTCNRSFFKSKHKLLKGSSIICGSGTLEEAEDLCSEHSPGTVLVINNILIGLVSWGVSCQKSNLLEVYLSTTKMIDWIHEIKASQEIIFNIANVN